MYADISDTKTGIRFNKEETQNAVDFHIKNQNLLLNATYTRFLKDDRTSYYAGASFSGNYDQIRYAGTPMAQSNELLQIKVVFKKNFTNDLRLLTGGEYLGTFLYGRSDSIHSIGKRPSACLFCRS